MTFQDILEKHRELSFTERDKGSRFERLIQGYLKTIRLYENFFDKVWLWNEFPFRDQFGKTDIGIDLVALTKQNEYWAIQCKCYQEDAYTNKEHVDRFLVASAREFTLENKKKAKFSRRLWISTTNKWGPNAEEALHNQNPPVSRISLFDLETAPVDWEKIDEGIFGYKARIAPKSVRSHQKEAIEKVHEHFRTEDRGKLIMACGTGKTYTSLKIAEKETNGKGQILVLVPSIALMGQLLKEWSYDAEKPINAICICSDIEVSKKKHADDDTGYLGVETLALPASTDTDNILRQFEYYKKHGNDGLTVVFSTYQSIDVISKAQKTQGTVFDLIVCDEAHRTTGFTLAGEEESAFVRVHSNDFIKGKKRLYMTATPRIFSDDSKSKADRNDAFLCSMDDENLYGREIFRLGFGRAVEEGLLADYKVLVLTLNDQSISPSVQKMVTGKDFSISSDDAAKLAGCISALSKHIVGDDGVIRETDPLPMKRAVAFCQNIKISKETTDHFNEVSGRYIADLPKDQLNTTLNVNSRHIDGTMNATTRDDLMGWLKAESDECRVLTNVRCLSEGVDVPSLDAVMFLAPKNSQIDVVQSVGRVMRLSEGKKYGYILIPVVIPGNVTAEKALDDNARFKVVWTVLNALRAHDDRFNSTINKIELNKKKPDNILVVGPDTGFENGKAVAVDGGKIDNTIQTRFQLEFEELQSVIFARMVNKVGERDYWDQWAKSVADIAEKQTARLNTLVKDESVKQTFNEFLEGLRQNINPEITEEQAIEMLSQHMITKPVFEALFENYSFAEHNAVSKSMQKMINLLESQAIEKDTQSLDRFYESVRKRVTGIDNAEGRQHVIIELYDKFFKTAFPKMANQLGIVYTPVQVVDFIVHSIDEVLKKEFNRNISDENVHILDPFTGTGTFITRLLQSELIKPGELKRKYLTEIHANEIVLLAYYIAAVNIENAYHDLLTERKGYQNFPGICLTDTFQLGEDVQGDLIRSNFFPQNSESVTAQQKTPITVIMSNPPYYGGQDTANDNIQNVSYPKLEKRIADTYAKETTATNKNSLYNSYFKAFRWSSDRLDKQYGGIICFVSNGLWIDGKSHDGFRKQLEKEFNTIYVFNLRGNQRTSGIVSKKEGGKIFGSGSRSPISITLLVKNPKNQQNKAKIFYHDIGDYLTREEKLSLIEKFGSINNPEMDWELITPNRDGDWINQRNAIFKNYIPLGDKKGVENDQTIFVNIYSRGLETARDIWTYNSSSALLEEKMKFMVNNYNEQVDNFQKATRQNPDVDFDTIRNNDLKKISWSSSLISDARIGKKTTYQKENIVKSVYRPFFKQFLYYDEIFNHRVGKMPNIFPPIKVENLVICITGIGVTKEFSCIMVNEIPDVQLLANGQCFPLYTYEEKGIKKDQNSSQTFLQTEESDFSEKIIKKDGITDFALEKAKQQYRDPKLTKADIFHYVYGILHSPDYRRTFSNDLKKTLPRIPFVKDIEDFRALIDAGKKLAALHLNYETIPPYPEVIVTGTESKNFKIIKMKFPQKGQKDIIIYNNKITISGIPDKAYQFIINGKSAVEWLMERYQVVPDLDTGITNDPNDWADEVGNPRYILDLLLSIINVSVLTVDIVEGLPKLKFE